MERNNHFNYLLYMLTTFVVGSFMFLIGFFSVSTNLIGQTGKHHYENLIPTQLDEYTLQRPSAKYERIILMIIDAWRTDYPNATNMPFANERGCNYFQIKVGIPTVTMPRLKSMTSGTISNFIDIVLNLGHTSKLEDSILHRLNERNKKSVFAGDRTWELLFPNEFLRKSVNSDSFFVNDFYQGDKNVTMTMKEELHATDWHLMILHYLGLDHIGHVEGSHNSKIFQKLLEMDEVIKYIVNNNSFKKSLLLVTGDHGMRNGGSHGGSDKEEMYVPLLEFQKKCLSEKRSFSEYNQMDMAPTLSVLLDAEIPFTSIGCLIPEMLEIYSKEEQLYFYFYNALHLMEKLKAQFKSVHLELEDYFSWYTEAKINHKHFISSKGLSSLSYEKAKQNYIRLSKKVTQILSESLDRYNMPVIIISLSLTTLSAFNLILNILFESRATALQSKKFLWKIFFVCFCLAGCINYLTHVLGIISSQNLFNAILITVSISLSLYFLLDIFKLIFNLIVPPLKHNRKLNFKLTIPLVLLSLFLIHTLSLASSSLIEEEHQTWYYFTTSLLLFLTLQNFYNDVKSVWQKDKFTNILLNEFWKLRFVFISMLAIIGCRRLNQTGDKWRHLEDIGDVLSKEHNYVYLVLIFLLGLFLLFLILQKYNTKLEMVCCFVALTCVFLYRHTTSQYSRKVLILFWVSIIATVVIHYRQVIYTRKNHGYESKGNLVELLKTNLTCSLLISALLHKPHNVILLPALMQTLDRSYYLCDNLHLTDKRVYNRCYVLVLKTVITIFIANMFYFFQGNSNSLTTIDLNPGYIGLSSYNPFIVGTFITLNTYCAPINAFLYLMWHMFYTQRNMLPLRQEKEQHSNIKLLESTEEDLFFVYGLFAVTTIIPVAVYWCLLVGFRYHLFIYSVFAPKAFYQCFHLLVFYMNFILTNLYFRSFLK